MYKMNKFFNCKSMSLILLITGNRQILLKFMKLDYQVILLGTCDRSADDGNSIEIILSLILSFYSITS